MSGEGGNIAVRFRQARRFDLVLGCIALLSAFLNIFGIWKDQFANSYYTAAVTSMLHSWHNFFFASFDPAGYITIDKPPVAFWVQTAFAYLFGVHGWSVVLPQALAGVGSVLLIYYLVKPAFGKTAARLASLVMACSPIAVAVSRTNNIDSLLVFTLLLATWMLFRAISTQKPLWVLGAFAVIGVGFNMKMFQAYMVVPAFYLFYLLAFKGDWRKKLATLAAATVVLVVVTFSWAAIVDAIPQANRPYIGGSRTNSVLELALQYNGISRLEGMGGPGGGGAPGQPQMQRNGEGSVSSKLTESSNANDNGRPRQLPGPGGNGAQQQMPPSGGNGSQGFGPSVGGNGPQAPGGDGQASQGRGRGGGMFGTGYPGPLRLFQSELSGQISWLLPLVGFACLVLLADIRRRRALTAKQRETLFWLGWLLPGMVFFSVAGFYHQYYLIMLAPPIAALAGAGWVELYNLYREQRGWNTWLLPVALLAATAFELYILQPYQKQIGTGWSIAIGTAGAAIALGLVLGIAARKIRPFSPLITKILAGAGMLVLLAAPLYWSATLLLYGDNSSMPAAGPGDKMTFNLGPGGGGARGSNTDAQLLAYVTRNNTGEPCLFATTDSQTAQSYIIAGRSVIALGGFSGGDNTLVKLEQMVKDKQIKFFLISPGAGLGGGGRDGNNEVASWIRAHSTEVPAAEWQSGSDQDGATGMGGAQALYKINE
ncbi:MAG: glycosyltransferase family 39 protein [Thermacetogeniaceae bacterium]